MFDTIPDRPSATAQAETLLGGLRDLDGIWGAFVLSSEGELLMWDVPRSLSEEALDAVAPRLATLREVLSTGANMQVDFLTLRFSNHRLCIGGTPSGLICVITAISVNLAALRMAMNLISRRLDRLLFASR